MSENYYAEKVDTHDMIRSVRAGNQGAFETLLALYEPMIGATVRRYAAGGQDIEDSRQEALAGFYRAVISFDLGQPGVAFGLYAKICVTNALITHARETRRRTHGTADVIEYEDYLRYRADFDADPAGHIIERENEAALRELIKRNLSDFENTVWNLYVSGSTSHEIARMLSKQEKSIANALYRIRRKLRLLLENNGL